MAAIADYLNIWHQINEWHLNGTANKVIWRWTSNGKFTM